MSDDPFQDLDEPLPEDRSGGADEENGPEVAAPEVESPSANVPTPTAPASRGEELEAIAADVDPAFKALFWKLVVLYKVGIIGLTLGVLLAVTGTFPTRGTILAVGGVVLLAYALVRTRRGKHRLDAGEFDLDAGDDPEDSTGDGDPAEGGQR